MLKEKYIRKITKKGNYSYYFILPKDILDKYDWQEHQKLIVRPYGKNKILIEDWKK